MDNIQLTQPDLKHLQPPLLMKNNRGTFSDVSDQAGAAFQKPLSARGVAVGDLNNDGFLDVAVNCNDQPAVIFQNTGGSNHWLLIELIGKSSNRDGMGAKLRLVLELGAEQHGYVSTAGSYLSSNDKRVHFGLGKDSNLRLLEITWPSGAVQRVEGIAADQILTVTEPEGKAP